MIINHNLAGANAIRNANANSLTASKSMQKLSSGLRINNAADDAAGLAISEKMRGQIRGLDQASSNAQDAISMTQTGEGALNETQSILQRMRELATQSANDTNVTVDRTSIQKEMNQLTSEINRIGNTTEFNTQKLLNGGTGGEWEAKTTGTATAVATMTGSAVITLKIDGANKTVSIASGAGIASVVDQINTIAGTSVASLDATGKLVLESKKGDATGSVQIVGLSGTAAADLKIATGDKVAATKVDLAATIKGSATAVATTTGIGAITFEMDGVYKTVSLASSAGIASIVDQINAVAPGVASLDGTGKLVLESTTTGNDSKLQIVGLSGTAAADLKIATGAEVKGSSADFEAVMQIGANQGQNFTVGISDMRSAALKVTGVAGDQTQFTKDGQTFVAKYTSTNTVTDGTTTTLQEAALDVSSKDNATAAIKILDDSINTVSAQRSSLGAAQNRLEHTINNLGTASENMTTAESRIRDVDMAKEMSTFSKNNILSQAAQAMLAQANQQPQQVLQLLR